MSPWLIVLGILLICVVFVLWLATDCEILVDVLPDDDQAAENLDRAHRELGEQAWYTLQRMHRDAVMECRHLRAVRMNPETELAIRTAIGQVKPEPTWRSGTLGRLYGIDVIVSPAVPDGVIVPIDNSTSGLLDLHHTVGTYRPPLVDIDALRRSLEKESIDGMSIGKAGVDTQFRIGIHQNDPISEWAESDLDQAEEMAAEDLAASRGCIPENDCWHECVEAAMDDADDEDLAASRGCIPENDCWHECVEAAMDDADDPARPTADDDRADDGRDGSVGGGCEPDSG